MHIVEMSTSIPVNPVDNIHMAGEDRISELPVGILDNILGFLPIQEAARTVILSSSWKDIWFSLTKLNFCHGFFDYICLKYSDAEGWKSDSQSPIWEVINKILMQHNGPIQKIVFDFSEEVFVFHSPEEFDFWDISKLLSYNLNQWFLLLTQNGVEEIDISCFRETKCQVPNCLLSCPTLKKLKLENVDVEPINDYCILPNVTSLSLRYVDFNPTTCSDYGVYLPMLEDLSFDQCDKIFYFNIVAPKLGSLEISLLEYSPYLKKKFGVLPPNLDLRSISRFDLICSPCCFEVLIKEHIRVGHAPALNFELLKLSVATCRFTPEYINNSAFINLLRACPKLCELDIWHLEPLNLNPEDFVLMEELSSVAQTLKMLRTLKFSRFFGLTSEVQTIKALLACFPGIKKVFIVRGLISSDEEFKIMQKLLDFPRASTEAEFFYIEEF
ncbi:F-box/FBD/LRR-repeat protein At1g13570-like [Ipomoea triloba]|uniref:F-box/FBD/LRR-repeat protein At1g13570-like n=1 Tax=Ipomoea triloba TaxID=35885 RepID=UPI00125DF30D|nr:F-box/FBD/LRR-repeat protein At1g13570-like [Ipomoea triloba]XP_031121486.1 F-box/FBD/LRR-repeat protein At1g13570-like [Ipomoea triloba]XP_031121487.1 F-box/FBD/LRR-repeat protein At1g13570-like [Ipomoea triloba]